MKIVIAGAGAVGYHLAKLLSKENQDITLIDSDIDTLDQIGDKLDVMTIYGDAAYIGILKEAEVHKADLFIAVTTSESTNLLTSILAKQRGAKKTIARVRNKEYLTKEQKEYFRTIGIDSIISPEHFAAQEIRRLVRRASLTDIFDFEDGKLSIVGFSIDNHSKLVGTSISAINNDKNTFDYRGVALLRNDTTIIPRGHTILEKGDHLYLSIRTKDIDKVMPFVGKQKQAIKRIMIAGDTLLALRTAELMEDEYKVSVIMRNKERGKEFLDNLRNCLITIGDPSNIDLLEQEGLAHMDAFIALTPDSEINILSSLIAEDRGVYKTIALVDNEVYTHISQSIGVDTIINKKLIAANNIFRFVRKGSVKAITTLHGVDAEIIEFEISIDNKLTYKTLSEMNIPQEAIIAGVIRGSKTIIPGGNFQLKIGDKVIVFAMPEAITQVEELFK
ncbi:MAG: Trk system potassium transporter TrkA [Saprospiraceae bacterium]